MFLKFEAESQEFVKFEITRTFFSNSEMSEQLLVTEYFFNLFLEVSHLYRKLEQLEFKSEKNIWI